MSRPRQLAVAHQPARGRVRVHDAAGVIDDEGAVEHRIDEGAKRIHSSRCRRRFLLWPG